MTIRQLPEALANKIAAGEVVERPASVVKELIENSIDAGSKWIKIELDDAGLQRIAITDNGCGMTYEDCKKSILRHATSKIKYETDLFHIESLGFRGEALASIAAVSKLTLKTSTGHEAGTELYFEAGELVEERKSDARQGTEITVRQLFYNTPARLKYMKTVHTELGHITDLINRYALACPEIRFELLHNGRVIFSSTASGNVLQVMAQIYGRSVAGQMLELKAETNDFSLTGYICKPEVTRSSRNYMTFIVNGRFIKSQALTHAVLRAYDTLLPIHRSPIVVLSMTMDPVLVDVNVHPTKLEVRFSKEKELVNLIEETLRNRLRKTSLIPEMTRPLKREEKKLKEERRQDSFTFDTSQNRFKQERQAYQKVSNDKLEMQDVYERANEPFTVTKDKPETVETPETPIEEISEEKASLPKLYPIGQLHGTYILAQNEDGFFMIDQHAAQERIKYEFFREKLAQPDEELQTLLMPMSFDFTKDEQLFIRRHEEELKKAGLHFESFGENTFAIRSYPLWFPKGLEEETIRDMVEQIIRTGDINIRSLREELAIMMSCKGSIKANHYLTESDMERLLDDLSKVDMPYTCPHGRPVVIKFTTYEIEKMFKRIM